MYGSLSSSHHQAIHSSTMSTTASSATFLDNAPKVTAEISYLDRSVEKPYNYLYEPRPNGDPQNNYVIDKHDIPITDLSGTTAAERESVGFTTKTAGFEIIEGFGKGKATAAQWASEAWEDDAWIKGDYYDDIDQFFKQRFGATSTFIFDHTVRKRRTEDTAHLPDTPDARKPVSQAHSDQSRWAGENRIEKHLGKEMLERVKKGEVHAELINLWRPLRGPVQEMPLAVADSRTVSPGGNGQPPDWRESELRYPTWSGQTLAIHYNPNHKWYYYKGIQPNQAILLKTYDSETEVRTPHTAFVDPTSPADAEPRWSMEVRVLVFTEKNKA